MDERCALHESKLLPMRGTCRQAYRSVAGAGQPRRRSRQASSMQTPAHPCAFACEPAIRRLGPAIVAANGQLSTLLASRRWDSRLSGSPSPRQIDRAQPIPVTPLEPRVTARPAIAPPGCRAAHRIRYVRSRYLPCSWRRQPRGASEQRNVCIISGERTADHAATDHRHIDRPYHCHRPLSPPTRVFLHATSITPLSLGWRGGQSRTPEIH